MNYNSYMNLLAGVNFVGGAGQGDLSTVSGSSDQRTDVVFSSGVYQFYYMTIGGLSDLDDLGYYDTANNDLGIPFIYDREYTQLPDSGSPSLSVNQAYLVQAILHTSLSDAYSVTFEDVAKVQFNTGAALTSHIVIGQTAEGRGVTGGGAYTLLYGNDGEQKHGDIWLNEDAIKSPWVSTEKGWLGYSGIMHEIGHALGLAELGLNPDYTQQYSIMSYNYLDGMNPVTDGDEVTPFGLQLLDIAAIQEIYGRNYDTRDTATTYSQLTAFSSTRPYEAFIYTIWDGGGVDEIDVSAYGVAAKIDLRQGNFSDVGRNAEGGIAENNLAVAYYSIIENVTGTIYYDTIIGNAWDNKLVGGGGNDHIYGDGIVYDGAAGFGGWESQSGAPRPDGNSSGNDILIGGDGEDWLYGGAGHDTVDYAAEAQEPGGTGRGGISGTLDASGNGTIIDTYGDTDHLFGIETVTMTSYNDSLTVANVIGRTVDGSGGTNSLHYNGYIVWDMAQSKYLDGTGTFTDTLSNIQTTTFDHGRILPNLSTDLSLALNKFKMVDYTGTSAGATINVLSDSYIDDLGSYYSGQLLLSADVLVGGHTHSYTFGGTSFSSTTQGSVFQVLRDSTRANIAGTGGVDTINISGSTPAILPVSINGGKGDDIINVSGGNAVLSGLTIVYGIDGGDDTVNGAGSVTEIYLGGNIRYTDVTRDLDIDDGEILIAGHGKITLNDYALGTVIRYGDGRVESLDGSIVYSAGGIGEPEEITGSEQADEVSGLAGDDTVYAYAGNDTIQGGAGNDILYGGAGNDTYTFAAGDGYDTIYDVAGNNTLRVTGTISSSDLAFARVGDDLRIEIGSGVTLKDYFINFATIEKIVFDSGPDFYIYSSALTATEVVEGAILDTNQSHTVNGTAGHDAIYAFGGNDTLNGLAGDDALFGGEGSDTYNVGQGFDEVYDEWGSADIVNINANIADAHDITYADGNLRIDLGGGNGVLIRDQGTASNHQFNIETIQFSDRVLPGQTGWQILDGASSTFYDNYLGRLVIGSSVGEEIYGFGGNDILSGGGGNDTLYGGEGADVLYGGAGDDVLSMDIGIYDDDILAGGEGHDTYKFRANSGDAIIVESSGADLIEAWFELRFPDFSFSRSGDDLLISTVSNTLTIRGQYSDDEGKVVEYLQYYDGSETQNFDLRTLNLGGNSAPVAEDDSFSVNEDTPLNGNVLSDNGSGADSDPDDDDLTVTAGTFATAQGGSVAISANGDFTYTPPANFHGVDSFDYTVSDTSSETDTGTVTITVNSVNDAPVISSNGSGATASVNVSENSTAVTTVIASDVDAGAALSYSISGGTDAAKFSINSTTGVLSFVSAQNYESPTDAGGNNVYDVQVQVSDGTLTDTQDIAVTVTNVNEAPVISSNGGGATASLNILEGTTSVATVAASDVDAATTLTYSISGGADSGKFSINSTTGVLSFLLAPDYDAPTDAGANNVYDVQVQVSDGALTDTQDIAVTVLSANHAPVAENDVFSIAYGTTLLSENLFADNGSGADSDADLDTLSITPVVVTTAQGVSVSISSNGNFTYSPKLDYVGTDSFSYTVLDGNGGSDTATVSITITAPSGAIVGTSAGQTLTGTSGDETIFALAGNDTVNAGSGHDIIYGGAGVDTLRGQLGNDYVHGGDGDDDIRGNEGNDTLVGGAGNDIIRGDSETDVAVWNTASTGFIIYRNSASYIRVVDTNSGSPYGNDMVYNDIETIQFADVTLDLTTMTFVDGGEGWGAAAAVTTTATSYTGTQSRDIIYGSTNANTLNGGYGNDDLYGMGSNDTLNGGYGNDYVNGGDHDDDIRGADGDDTLVGGAGSDIIRGDTGTDIAIWDVSSTGFIIYRNSASYIRVVDTNSGSPYGNDIVYNDVETIQFTDITLDLTAMTFVDGGEGWGTAATVTTTATSYTGTQSRDIVYGSTNANTLNGGYGNDDLYGMGSNDTLNGGYGNDYVNGGDHDDDIRGADGNDTLVGGAGSDIIRGDTGTDIAIWDVSSTGFIIYRDNLSFIRVVDTNSGSLYGNDRVYDDVETIQFSDITLDMTTMTFVNGGEGWGTAAAVTTSNSGTYTGTQSRDIVYGGTGTNTLNGGYGNDDLYGMGGNDTLNGGYGNDKLYGGAGTDSLTGGAGSDTFVFEAASAFSNVDTVSDFSTGQGDAIDISDVISLYDPLNDVITDWVEFTTSGSNSILKIDRDGTGTTYSFTQIATITGVTGLTDEASLVTNGNLIV